MKGKLIKNSCKWFIDYVAEKSGENEWHNVLPIFELEKETEQVADLILVKKYNKPVNFLEGTEVEWEYKLTTGTTNFGYEYASLV